jgi:hypothetical protein
MPVTDPQSELEAFRQLVEDRWTDCLVIWPNEQAKPPDPVDEKNAAYPARFIAVAVDYDPSPRITYGGTNEIRGQLVFSRWVQRGASDERLRDLAKKLKAMVEQFGDVVGLTFTGAYTESAPVDEEEFPFMGRAIAFEFVRFEEAIA